MCLRVHFIVCVFNCVCGRVSACVCLIVLVSSFLIFSVYACVCLCMFISLFECMVRVSIFVFV